jgi:hypothetical protein
MDQRRIQVVPNQGNSTTKGIRISSTHQLEWNLQRTVAKINHKIHTDAIVEVLIPPTLTKKQIAMVYASEAEVINMAVFGKTSRQWQENQKGNIRDHATLEQLIILSNLESINALLIRNGLTQQQRLSELNKTAIQQMKSLLNSPSLKQLEHKT